MKNARRRHNGLWRSHSSFLIVRSSFLIRSSLHSFNTGKTTMSAPFTLSDWLDREDALLAPFAMRTRLSKGRLHGEPAHGFRTLYQRDRDRVVHSTAFRRLMNKTQVFVTQTNDHSRTRLTHTL